MGTKRLVAPGVAAALAAVLLSGCVHVPSFDPPDVGDPGDVSGDAATFVIDGGSQSVVQSGSVEVSGYGEGIDYSGPLGCLGHYFTMSYTEHTDLFFHYSAVDALLAWGSGHQHHFAKPPIVDGKDLVWRSGGGAGESLEVRVTCPYPATATEPVLAAR